MITKKLTQPLEMSEEEAKREIDVCLEKIQASFDRLDQHHERFVARQRENRAILDDIEKRIARL